MENLFACRICLGTDVKLYDMFTNKLSDAYETLHGTQLSQQSDGLPIHICSYCSVLLLKSAQFQRKVRTGHEVLLQAANKQLLTNDYIKSVDRVSIGLTLPYTTSNNENIVSITEETTEISPDVPERPNVIMVLGKRVKLEESSDEEPLAKIVKKRKKNNGRESRKFRKKCEEPLQDVKDEPNQLDVELVDISNLAFIEDLTNQISDDDELPQHLLDEDVDTKPAIEELTSKDGLDAEVEVIELTEQEQRAEIENRKTSQNYLNSTYKCDQCYKGFLVDTAYNNHMEKHDPSFGTYICDICHIRFKHKHTLHSHVLNTHSRNYICKRCGHISKAKIKAKEHYQWHLGVVYPCDICGANFYKRTTLLTHVRIHHSTSSVCDICQMCFVSAHGLRMHRRKTHRVGTKISKNPDEFECQQCKAKFINIEALNKHLSFAVENICDTNLRVCYLCGDGFSTTQLLKQHVKQHQKNEDIECLECHKTYSSRRYYAAHYQRVHVQTSAKPARRGDSGKASAVCEICGKRCESKVTLVYHQRTHTGEKPYQCTECPKRFSVLQRLQYHLRTHTGERPCQCSYCPKAFRHKAALNRHVRVHTGAKPYVCQHCNKAFSQSNTLKGHVRTVHLKLPALYRKSNTVECE